MTEQIQHGQTPGTAVALVERISRQVRATLIVAAWLKTLALVLALVLILGILDYVFRLPRGIRILHLALLGYCLFEFARRALLPTLRFRPGHAEIALRIERLAADPKTYGRLASGVEFGSLSQIQDQEASLTSALAAQAASDADVAAEVLTDRRFLKRTLLVQAGALFALAILITVGTTWTRPDLARIGLARTLWPFGESEWPKRTALVDVTDTPVHPLGEALPLRTLLTRTALPMGETDVYAVYRVLQDGKAGQTVRVLLTPQRRIEKHGDERGELFERLIEPAVDVTDDVSCEIAYWFETADNRTDPSRLLLAARPRVEKITVRVDPPPYAATLDGAFLHVEALTVSPDGEGVVSVQPVLSDSRVRVSLELNTPAKLAVGMSDGWSQPDDRALVYETTATEQHRLSVVLRDPNGLENAEPLTIVLDVVPDSPASVTILKPAYDSSVLASAVISLKAEGRDDFGMSWLSLSRQTARVPAHSEGASAEPLAAPVRLGDVHAAGDEVPTELTLEDSLDLATIGVRAGDEVWIWATGRDVFFPSPEGDPDDRSVLSALRRLRIIDEATFIDQIRGELVGVRRAAIEIDTEQHDLSSTNSYDPTSAAERQEAITHRLHAQQRAVSILAERVAQNALDDESLRGTLDDAQDLLRLATRASDDAAESIERIAEDEHDSNDLAEVSEAQDQVRTNLETLIAMLDHGQDNWVARRTIEGLLAEQQALTAESSELGRRTMGLSRDQLSEDELTELERIAARQQDAADRARQALDMLSERAAVLDRIDSAQSGAMARAARRGRQEHLDEHLRQAAAQLRENQTRAAAQGQEAAIEAFEQMLEDIDSAEASRDEALRRVLASVLESLARLIDQQEQQIDSLSRAPLEADLGILVTPMIALIQNTLGLLDEIGPQRDLAALAPLLQRAVAAQERAVGSLRESSIESAAEAEDESLFLLRAARDEVERMEREAQNRENTRQRNELRRAYRELLEQQVVLAADTQPWIDSDLDRRARSKVRALGQRQSEITISLAELLRTTEGLAETLIFELAHRRLESASVDAADTLLSGKVSARVTRQQNAIIRVLQSLVESLAERNPDRQFQEQHNGGGADGDGGGQGGQTTLIPELAELLLLRAMQADAMEWTRTLDESPKTGDSEELTELAEFQQELAEHATLLIDKLTQQSPQTPQHEGGMEIQP